MPTRWKSLRFGPLEAVAVASVLVAGVAWAAPRPAIRKQVGHEEKAAALVARVAAAEQVFRTKKALDADRDGAPEYGTLQDLVRAGLLSETPRHDAEGDFLEESGYRVEVLLPSGPMRGGGIALARSTGKADPALSAGSFAVVGIPTGAAGRRAIYVDALGRTFVSEGVSDDQGNSLKHFPARMVEREEDDLKDGSTLWHLPVADRPSSKPPKPPKVPKPRPG